MAPATLLSLTPQEKSELLSETSYIRRRAWSRLWQLFFPRLVSALLRRNTWLSEQDAKEVATEAFTAAFSYSVPARQIAKYDPLKAIVGNAHNILVSRIRHDRAERRRHLSKLVQLDDLEADELSEFATHSPIVDPHFVELLKFHAEKLPGLQKAVFGLLLKDPDATANEIAKILSATRPKPVSPQNVISALKVAQRKLRPIALSIKKELEG